MPKFAMFVRATAATESGKPPPDFPALLERMTAYNDALTKAGVMLDANGLLPSSRGARVQFSSGGETTVTNGPFEPASLVSGYWIIQTESLEEAVAWARKVPFTTDDSVVEVRQISSPEDFKM